MKVYEICFSPTGGTEKVLSIISSVWEKEKIRIDLSNSQENFKKFYIEKDDVCLIAVPSFGGRVPSIAIERLSQINGNGAKAVLIAVYGNRAFEDTLSELEDCAKMSGFVVSAAIAGLAEHSIARKIAGGRPDAEDRAELMSYAEKIKAKIDKGDESKPNIPGNHNTYKEYNGVPLKPEPNRKCIKCGVCKSKCPVDAIDDDFDTIKDKCISCMRCVSLCPCGARDLNKAMVFVTEKKLSKACSNRKSPELFI